MANINRAIRFYQPSDPYYWQVDNLPLTDLLDNDIVLEERVAALEDSVNGLGDSCRGAFGVAAIADLKAYTEDVDGPTQNFGKVFVRPGKFTARMQIPATKETGWRMMRDDDDYFNNTSIEFGTGGLNTTTLTDDFVRYSRGTGRTSVVEFTQRTFNQGDQFVIIPSFDASEFNSNNAPSERIDLIYVTGHESLDTVNSDVGIQPSIGVIKGAYFRTDEAAGVQSNGPRFENAVSRRFGRITGMASTELTTGQAYGSLPSPDDLTNLAWHSKDYISDPSYPEDWDILMQKQFETKAYFALPVAYVRVPQGYVQGQHIPCENVIDIRPFLRTTELTYNERAAIIASIAPSGKNPFVTDLRLRTERDKLSTDITALQGQVQTNTAVNDLQQAQLNVLEPNVTQLKLDVEGTQSSPSPTSLNHEGRIAALENLLGPGTNLPFERHVFLPNPYKVFEDAIGENELGRIIPLGGIPDPKTWNITQAIPAADREGIVAVQFRVWSKMKQFTENNTGGEDELIMRSAGIDRMITFWGIALDNADPRSCVGNVNTFYAPVTSLNGGAELIIETYLTATSQGRALHTMYIDGYISRQYAG